MAEIGRWRDHRFEVSPNVIRSWTDLQIKTASETEDKEADGVKYVSRRAGKPAEISLSIELNAMLGCEVREEAMLFASEAAHGKTGYFYVGNKKLLSCQMMLTEATVSETEITPTGTWVKAKLQLTMKQAGKYDSEAGAGAGGSYTAGGTTGSEEGTSGKTSLADVGQQLMTAAVKAGIQAAKRVRNAARNASVSSTGQQAAERQDEYDPCFQRRMAKEAWARAQEEQKKSGGGGRNAVSAAK